MARTLLQLKNRPIHRMKPTKTVVAYSWCGVDIYRKGVSTEGVNSGISKATCKDCLREEAKAAAKGSP